MLHDEDEYGRGCHFCARNTGLITIYIPPAGERRLVCPDHASELDLDDDAPIDRRRWIHIGDKVGEVIDRRYNAAARSHEYLIHIPNATPFWASESSFSDY